MQRVKVLHLITNLQVGGATDNTLVTVAGHRRSVYEVHLAAGVVLPDENYTEWRDRSQRSADALHLLPDLRRRVEPWRDLRALRALTRLIRTHGYHVVHTHCSKAGFLGRIAARRAGSPIVVHTYHAFGWQVTAAPARSRPRRWISSVGRSAYLALERYTASLSDALITVSDLNKEMAIGFGLAPPDKFTTIHSGVDLSRGGTAPSREDLCRRLNLDPSRPIVGTVGRLARQKDPLTFVEAARRVLERLPDVQFIMIGDGPLASQVEDALRGEQRIQMLGYRDDVSEIITLLDAFVLSSRWEGLGRALTEAVGAGIPVAATAVDGVPELVSHGVTGRLSPPGEAAALADNVEWILTHREAARRMATHARKRVFDEWGADQMVKRIEALYERLLTERGLRNAPSAEVAPTMTAREPTRGWGGPSRQGAGRLRPSRGHVRAQASDDSS